MVVQVRERGCAVGIGQRRDRLARLLRRLVVVAVVIVVGVALCRWIVLVARVVAMIGMVRMSVVTGVVRVVGMIGMTCMLRVPGMVVAAGALAVSMMRMSGMRVAILLLRLRLPVSGVVTMTLMRVMLRVRFWSFWSPELLMFLVMRGRLLRGRLLRMMRVGILAGVVVMPMALRQQLSRSGRRAQRGGKHGAGEGGRAHVHSSTLTSRIMPASMW